MDSLGQGEQRQLRARASSQPHRPGAAHSRSGTDANVKHIVDILWQTAEATAALHKAQVVHRDIKPDNIMVTPEGFAVLTDLGLAHVLDEQQAQLTQTRQFVGTVRYASPEQILDAKSVDFRSDVYSLGATLWEALTLQPIYGAADISPLEAMSRVMKSDSPPPSRYNRRVPHDLDAVVMKCLEKEPARRYSTARELADDLRRWLNNEPVSATPPTLRYLLGKKMQQHWQALAATGAALAAITFCICISLVLMINNWRQTRALNVDLADANQQLVAATERANTHAQDADRHRRTAELQRYVSDIRLASTLLAADDPLQARAVLRRHEPEAGSQDDLRGSEWWLLWRQCVTNRDPIASHENVISRLAHCPSQSLAAWTDWGGRLVVKDFETVTVKLEREGLGQLFAVELSSDGRYVAAGGKGQAVHVWDLQREGPGAFSFESLGETVTEIEFDADNKLLLAALDSSRVLVWDLERRKLIKTLGDHTGHVHGLEYGANTLVSGDAAGYVVVRDAKTFATLRRIRVDDAPVLGLTFSPDGEFLSVAGGDSDRPPFLKTFRTADWTLAISHTGLRNRPYTVVFSEDSRHLFAGTSDGSLLTYDPEQPQPLHEFLAHNRRITSMVFLPKQSRLLTASSDGHVLAWNWKADLMPALTPLRSAVPGAASGVTSFTVGNSQVYAIGLDEAQHLTAVARDRLHMVNCKNLEPIMSELETTLLQTASISDDGSLAVVSAYHESMSNVSLWHLQMKRRETLLQLPDRVVTTHVTPDQQTILLGTDQGRVLALHRIQGATARELTRQNGSLFALANSPDGASIAVAWQGTLLILDARTLSEKHRLGGLELLHRLAYSPDGRELHIGTMRGRIYTADLTDVGLQLRPDWLEAHRDHIMALAVSPDGRTLVSGSADGTIKFWNRVTSNLLLEMRPPVAGHVLCLRFSGDGRQLLAGLTSGQAVIWSTAMQP